MNKMTNDSERRGGALPALALCMLLPSLGVSIANVALPALATAFNAGMAQVQWVVLAYLLSTTALVVGAGRLGDRVGRRRLLLAGLVLFTAASALSACATSLGTLIAARALQGAGAAVLMALTLALVGESVPKAQAGRAMGLLGTMSAVGTALGPSLGGVLVEAFGWRAIFIASVPPGLLAMGLVWRCLPAGAPSTERGRFDVAGLVLLALTLVAYALALTPGRGQFGVWNAVLLSVAVAALMLLVRVEARASSPLLQLALLRDAALATGLAVNAAIAAAMMATMVVGPFYLAHGLGLGLSQVGLVLAVGPAVAALTGVPAGRWVDRFGAPRCIAAGLLGMAAGFALLAALPARWGVVAYVLPLAALTASYAVAQAANSTAVMAGVPDARRGVVAGLLTLARNLGFITGGAVLLAVFGALPNAVTGMRASYGLAALLMVAALAVALRHSGFVRRHATRVNS